MKIKDWFLGEWRRRALEYEGSAQALILEWHRRARKKFSDAQHYEPESPDRRFLENSGVIYAACANELEQTINKVRK